MVPEIVFDQAALTTQDISIVRLVHKHQLAPFDKPSGGFSACRTAEDYGCQEQPINAQEILFHRFHSYKDNSF